MASLKEKIQETAAEIVDAADFVDTEKQQAILEKLQSARQETEQQILESLEFQVVTNERANSQRVLAMPVKVFLEKFHKLNSPALNKLVLPLTKDLHKNGIAYVLDLVKLTKKQALKLEGIGPKRIRILQRYLQLFGLNFGMEVTPVTTEEVHQLMYAQYCKNKAGTL